jgi:hypothetical protein
MFFFGLISWCSQSGTDPHEDLAKFGYKLNTKSMYFITIFLYFWLPTKYNVYKSGDFFLYFGQILANWKSQKALDIAHFNS